MTDKQEWEKHITVAHTDRYGNATYYVDWEKLKDAIQTLNQQRKKWVSELEGEEKINCEENPKSDFIDFQVLGYNQGLQTAIDKLGGKE